MTEFDDDSIVATAEEVAKKLKNNLTLQVPDITIAIFHFVGVFRI